MARSIRNAAIVLFLLVSGPSWANAQTDQLLNSLEPAGYVNDFAGVMAGQAGAVEALLAELDQKTGAQVVIVTLPNLDGGQIDDFANRLFERWGIGSAGEDNGILIITAIEDRQYRVEVGYGLEPIIPDARAGRIMDEVAVPAFQAGDFGAGLTGSAAAIATIIADDAGIELTGAIAVPQTQSGGRSPFGGLLRFLVLLFLLPFIIRNPWLALFLLSSGRGGGFGGGGFGRGGGGGGFGGFGGGMSGGGGASGSW